MASYEERAEFARKLREWDAATYPEPKPYPQDPLQFIGNALGLEAGANIMSGLADFVEPEGVTCEMEFAGDVPAYIGKSCWFCSNCGSPIYNDMKPYYCLYCGAEVER